MNNLTSIAGKNKFTLEKCRNLLNAEKNGYTDDQVMQIRDFLFALAELEIEYLEGLHKANGINTVHVSVETPIIPLMRKRTA